VGALTAFFAATTGLLQNDIKRVIAYSTCSQMGYLFMAVGISQYSVALFHLVNHALTTQARIKLNFMLEHFLIILLSYESDNGLCIEVTSRKSPSSTIIR